MDGLPSTQAIADPVVVQTQDVTEADKDDFEVWGKLISLTSDPCFDLSGKDTYKIGRHPSCDVVFSDNLISSFHCSITINRIFEPHEVYVTDTSTNGTYVNGVRLIKNDPCRLIHGDSICFVFANNRQNSKAHAFVFQNPLLPLRVADSCVSQELDGIEDKYVLEGQLGKGSFGIVKLCRERKTGNMYAAKIVDLKQLQYKQSKIKEIICEAELLASLHHPGIPFMKEIIQGKKNIYIIMELVTGGDLFDRIIKLGHYDEIDARLLMKNLLLVIKYLHEQEIVHRDIKPENVLLIRDDDNTQIKVTDFGLAKYAGDGLHTYCGTPQYYAPEILERRGNSGIKGSYGKPVDMWSVGVLLYVMLAGELPFDSNMLSQQILNSTITFKSSIWQVVSAEAEDLISRLIVHDPIRRLTVQQALQHPWIENKEFSILGSQLASQFLSPHIDVEGMLCEESLSVVQPAAYTDANAVLSNEKVDEVIIIADSQEDEEVYEKNDMLWKNRGAFYLSQSQIPIPQYIEKKPEIDSKSNISEKNGDFSIVDVTTPEAKYPAAIPSADLSNHSSYNSRQNTPFRNGIKKAIVSSSVFDALIPVEKRERENERLFPEDDNINPSPKRAAKVGKKNVNQIKNITSYFSPKKPIKSESIIPSSFSPEINRVTDFGNVV